jgi:hypothetical protein
LTHPQPENAAATKILKERGVQEISMVKERASIGDDTMPVEFIPYTLPGGQPGGAVAVKRAGVLFAGPAAINGPRARLQGCDLSQWIATLQQLQKLSPTQVVPGYGSWGGAAILERQKSLFSELRRQVAYNVAMGIPLARLEKEVAIPAGFFAWMPYDTPTPEDIRWVYGELTVRGHPTTVNSLRKMISVHTLLS